MASNFKITIDGIETVSARFRGISKKCSNFEPMFQDIKKVCLKEFDRQFQVEGEPKWAQLKENTIKNRGGFAHPILQRTGELRADVIGKGKNSVSEITPKSAMFGVEGVKAIALQRGRANMKGRKFIALGVKAVKDVMTVAKKYLYERT